MARYDRHGRFVDAGFGSDVDIESIRHTDTAPRAGVPVRWVYVGVATVTVAGVVAPAVLAAIPPVRFGMLAMWLTRCWVAGKLWNGVFG